MLADQIIACPESEFGRKFLTGSMRASFIDFTAALRHSQRFVLQRDAVRMILGVTESSPKRFLSAMSVCRLPYRRMWIEYAYRDRQDWVAEMDGKVQVAQHEDAPPPQRLGFYMEQEDETGHHILVQPAWVHDDVAVSIGQLALRVNTDPEFEAPADAVAKRIPAWQQKHEQGWADKWIRDPAEVEAVAQFEFRVEPTIPHWTRANWEGIAARGGERLRAAYDLAVFDLRSEWRFILALLTTLNSRNVISISDPVDMTKLNKSRRRSGKPELLDHREIRLSLSRAQRRRSGIEDQGGKRHDLLPHMVRGHWKLRSSGLYWWSAHVRGSGGEAPAARTYKVVA